jgi:hypothetical protein
MRQPHAQSNGWEQTLPQNAAAGPALNKDILRKVHALNPALASQGSTDELLSMLAGSAAPPQPAQQSLRPAPPKEAPPDFLPAYQALRQQHAKELARLDAQIAALQAEKQALPAKTLDRLMPLLVAADPNLTSPQTKEILRSDARFLDGLGFSVRKMIEHRSRK